GGQSPTAVFQPLESTGLRQAQPERFSYSYVSFRLQTANKFANYKNRGAPLKDRPGLSSEHRPISGAGGCG
ncbi:hypothetical protein, partial [Sphingobium jiangsuense]